MKLLSKLILIFILLVPTSLLFAGEDGGVESPFGFGVGARDLALGGSNIAYSSGYSAPFWNASALASVNKTTLGGFHSKLFDNDVSYQYFGIAYPTMDFGTIGIGVFRLGVDGIEVRDQNNFLESEISDNRLGFYLAYGKKVSNYNLGVALTIEHHSIGELSTTSSPGMNLSVSKRWKISSERIEEISAVISGHNIVRPGMRLVNETVKYPYRIDFGLSAKIIPNINWNHVATLSSTISKVDFVDPRLSFGLEYQIEELLALRTGYRESKFSYGIGLKYQAFSFDYAVIDRDLGTLHMFNFNSQFGASTKIQRELRAQKKEDEFNSLMTQRLTSQNKETVSQLLNDGKEFLDIGELEKALSNFDGALFLSGGIESDSSEIASYVREAKSRLRDVNKKIRYNDYLDSAWVNISSNDYFSVKYYSNLALTEYPNSSEADSLYQIASKKLEEESDLAILTEQRLRQADSLITYGNFDFALSLLTSIQETDDETDRSKIELVVNRAKYEKWKSKTISLIDKSNYSGARKTLDSAMTIYPEHMWCKETSLRIKNLVLASNKKIQARINKKKKAKPLSAELKKEIESSYQRGMSFFKDGDLLGAIEYWEEVARIKTDYKKNVEYLVNAYKYVGVELYSKNQLKEAVTVWKKTFAVDPGNQEILGYIGRTENEIKKLEELSYDIK